MSENGSAGRGKAMLLFIMLIMGTCPFSPDGEPAGVRHPVKMPFVLRHEG